MFLLSVLYRMSVNVCVKCVEHCVPIRFSCVVQSVRINLCSLCAIKLIIATINNVDDR
jgi:hypothetical protein